jgi:glycerophosphoryl diester phosphodiesterase
LKPAATEVSSFANKRKDGFMAWMAGVVAMACLAGMSALAAAADTGDAARAEGGKVEWVAHRGASYDRPENTMASFNQAWAWGTDACENDIHLTKDGKVIVCHDATTKRTTDKDLLIKNSTLEELRALDAGSFGKWKGSAYAGEKLPLLSECLASIPEGKRFFVEIKSGVDVVPAAVEVIKASGKKPEQIALISFHVDALGLAKKALPDHQCYLLAGTKKDKEGKFTLWNITEGGKQVIVPTLDELIARAKAVNADGLDVDYRGPIDAAGVQRMKQASLKFCVWTVDDPAAARRMIDMGAFAVTTNRCAWLKERVEGK